MNNEVRVNLTELVITYGSDEISTNIRRTEGLLRDKCGNHKREISVLISAMKNRIPEEILSAKSDTINQLQFSRLVNKLQDNEGTAEEYAKWAVESWAVVLGKETETKNTACSTDKESERMQSETEKSESIGHLSLSGMWAAAKMPAPFNEWTFNDDGTASDDHNKLMWIRAPWGMEWNGNSFTGEPVKLSWLDATRLHGQSKYVESTNMEWAHPSEEDINASRIENGYSWGTSIIRFAGYADWRLPTIYEWRTMQYGFYLNEMSRTGEYCTQTSEHLTTGFKAIFPTINSIEYDRFWPATCKRMDTGASKLLGNVFKKVLGGDSSGCLAWSASFYKFIDEDAKLEKHILLVRNI